VTAATVRERLRDVRLVRNVLIPLSDGVTLAADLHLPEAPGPHPTLISLYPYRKDDVIGSFSAYSRRWFAQRGYAHLLVDVRGHGGSEGRRAESLHPLPESADAGEVVEWAAAQEWSDGAVGVWGVSYGGLTALAAGAARPPHLRAIAPVYPLWDVRADWAAPGGCPAMLGPYQWTTVMLAQRLAPPTFRDADGRWLRVWRERLARVDEEGVDVSRWQEHRDDDGYWRERVLHVERIEVPTFLIGGWRDLFPEAVATGCERIPAPTRLLLGPWLHVQPDLAAREPVDWLPLLLAFWDEHLRDGPPADDPPALVFVQGSGGWRGDTGWPPHAVESRTLHPGPEGRLAGERAGGADEYDSTPLAGVTGGQWDPMGTGVGYPLDQGQDDLLSLTYTTDPLAEPLELAGSAEAVLDVERLDGEAPFDLVAKLVDLAPDGRAELIASGWARSDGGATTVRLWATAWALAAGHRLRLSVSCADFPRVWPDPTRPRIRVRHAGSELRLPVARAGIGEPVEPPRPTAVRPSERFPWTLGGSPSWTIERDLAGDAIAVTLGGGETMRLPEGGTLALRQRATARVAADHPEAASVEAEATIEIESADGERIEVEARGRSRRDRNLHWGRVTIDGCPMFECSWRSF
jgi:hypothetical protein